MSLALVTAERAAPRGVLTLPPEERPRERLQRQGPGALSNGELLAVVLGSGSSGRSASSACPAGPWPSAWVAASRCGPSAWAS